MLETYRSAAPIVSAIMPVYNGAAYLRETVNSIVA
jgi:glycosyltransferase involved in cell wall biosynthesis